MCVGARARASGRWLPAAVVFVIAACGGSSTFESSAAPPTVICGTTLNTSAAGASVYDATKKLATVTEPTVGGLLFIQVSDDCGHGAHVQWTPAGAARLVKQAAARDGLPAAVVLQPATSTARFTVRATRDGRTVAAATVRLSG